MNRQTVVVCITAAAFLLVGLAQAGEGRSSAEVPSTQPEVRQTVSCGPAKSPEQLEHLARQRREATRILRQRDATDAERDAAVGMIAACGPSPGAIDTLLRVALEPPATDRDIVGGNAALRLRDWKWAIPASARSEIRDQVRQAADKYPGPIWRRSSLLWLLAGWDDADWVWDRFARKLPDDTLRIYVLCRLRNRGEAVEELHRMTQRCRPITELGGWQKREDAAAALARLGDKRGVDMMLECLNVGQSYLPKIGYSSTLSSTLAAVGENVGQDFTRGAAGRSVALSDAIELAGVWWKANRQAFRMELPAALPDGPLNRRQARLLATRLINAEFARWAFRAPSGVMMGQVEIRDEWMSVRQDKGRWHVRLSHSNFGPNAEASFNLDGTGAETAVSYVLD